MIGRTYQQYQEFYDDIGLMCRNAMTYNEDESEVFKDAQQILDIMEGYRGQIEDRINRPAVDKPRPRVSGPTPRADSSSFAQPQRQSYPYPNQTNVVPGGAIGGNDGVMMHSSGASKTGPTLVVPAIAPFAISISLYAFRWKF